MNLLCFFTEGYWYLKIIPRKKHRPSIYYADADSRIRISPASIDLSGLLVVPFEDEFYKINTMVINSAFSEVCMTDGEFTLLCDKLTSKMNQQ